MRLIKRSYLPLHYLNLIEYGYWEKKENPPTFNKAVCFSADPEAVSRIEERQSSVWLLDT